MEQAAFLTEDTEGFCLFPHFVCRVSGLPVESVELLRAAATSRLFEQMYQAEHQLHAEREAVAALLYETIGGIEEKKDRARLLRLKRDLYNLRSLQPEAVAVARRVLPEHAAPVFEAFVALKARYDHLMERLARSYAEETKAARRAFQQFIEDDDFQKGLLLSSRSLFRSQRKYRGAVEAELSGKKEKIERGLLRYFSRMAMKATPFGTFCAVLPGVFSDETRPEVLFEFAGDPRRKRSALRLNKSLFGVLLRQLKKRPAVRNHLHVEGNPTMRSEAGRLVFLTAAADGREVFQRVPRNPVLDLLSAALKEHTSLPLGALSELLQTAVEASEDEAIAYLDRLIEIGFLRFRTGIREQEADWDLPFRAILEQIDDDHAQYTVRLLEQLRKNLDAFAAAAVDERAGLLEAMQAQIQNAFEDLKVEGRLIANLPFYEDATAASTARLSGPGLAPLNDTLHTFVRLMMRLAWPRPEKANLRHFFDTYYESRTPSVPLLQFYEDYYREHFKVHLEKQDKTRNGVAKEEGGGYDFANPFKLDIVRRIQAARKRLETLIIEGWKAQPFNEIKLTREDLEDVLQDLPPVANRGQSISCFVQMILPAGVRESPRLLVPLGIFYAGYGKYFSRFLYLLPEAVQTDLYASHLALSDQCLAEICGDANFNANLHPPLLPWEISYPTGESGDAEEQLRSADLYVEPDAEAPQAVCLRHGPTGKRVLPVDLGFLNPRMRPPLYQLLSRFTTATYFSVPIPKAPQHAQNHPEAVPAGALEGTAPPEPHILYRPRITYEGALILTRKCWFVPSALFPVRSADESSFDYFLRVNRWRKTHGIPCEVFVRISPLPHRAPQVVEGALPEVLPDKAHEHNEAAAPEAAESPTPEEAPPPGQGPNGPSRKRRTAVSRDLHKPQYIDFSSPLLVGLFGKMTVNLDHFMVTLEERLPASEQLPRHHDSPYATELIWQLNFPEGPAGASSQPHRQEEPYAL